MAPLKDKKVYFGYKPKETNVQKLEKYISKATLPPKTLNSKNKNKKFQ